jgi:hypothetical protein
MNVGSVQAPALQAPTLQAPALPPAALSPEEMAAIAAARPTALHRQDVVLASLQQQGVTATSMHNGTTGQGTPAIDAGGHVDLYA